MAYIGAGINQTKTSVENSKDEFFGTYYGRAATDPTADPLGNAIDDGDLFYNTTEDALKIRVGGEWYISSSPRLPVRRHSTYREPIHPDS
jgi:hypothetical protein